MGGERPGQTRDAGAQNDDVPGIAHVGAGRKNSTKPAMAGDYAGGWRDVAGVAAAIAAVTLSGRVNAKYSRANSGGRISTIDSFSTQTSITWNGPRLQRKHCQPSRCAMASTLSASAATLSAKWVGP